MKVLCEVQNVLYKTNKSKELFVAALNPEIIESFSKEIRCMLACGCEIERLMLGPVLIL